MELHDLLPVLTAPGPFLTVHVESESDVEQAADKYAMQWKALLKDLGERGVDSATLEALDSAKGEHSDGASRLVVVSTGDHEVRLAVSLPTAPPRPVAEVAPLPQPLPLVDDATARIPYVLVVADRTGAEVSGWYDVDQLAQESQVQGTTTIARNPANGNFRFQQHQHLLEKNWVDHLAKDIVDTAGALAEEIDAQLVIAVGDERELQAVKKHLPPSLLPRWVEVAGGRGQDGSDALVDERVRAVVARHVVDRTLTLLEDYAQERGQRKRAVDGLEDVVVALRKAQVQTLLVTTAVDRDAELFFGAEPSQLAMTEAELVELGVDAPQSGPAVDVLLRAAVGTGADVELVPHEMEQSPRGGVGAVLRYADSDPATPGS